MAADMHFGYTDQPLLSKECLKCNYSAPLLVTVMAFQYPLYYNVFRSVNLLEASLL